MCENKYILLVSVSYLYLVCVKISTFYCFQLQQLALNLYLVTTYSIHYILQNFKNSVSQWRSNLDNQVWTLDNTRCHALINSQLTFACQESKLPMRSKTRIETMYNEAADIRQFYLLFLTSFLIKIITTSKISAYRVDQHTIAQIVEL